MATYMADLLATHTQASQMSSFYTDYMGIYNVKSYGAEGDGSTDDSEAIQDAIDAAHSGGGGTVYFPDSNYYIGTTQLTFYTNVVLQGAGRGGTTITSNSITTSALAPNDSTATTYWVCINDITFDNTSLPGGTSKGIDLTNCSFCDLRNVRVKYFDTGIYAVTSGAGVSYYSTITNSYTANCTTGVHLDDGANSWTLINIRAGGTTGIKVSGGGNAIINPDLEGFTGRGIWIDNPGTFTNIFGGRIESGEDNVKGIDIPNSGSSNVGIYNSYFSLSGSGATYINDSGSNTQYFGHPDYYPWSTDTPTVTSGSGSITAYSSTMRYRTEGNRNYYEIKITVTTKGTAAGSMVITMPFTAKNNGFYTVASAKEVQTDGDYGFAFFEPNTTTLKVQLYDKSTPFLGDGNIWHITGWCEI